MAPDMSAETGLGASGWALGSHTWKGTTPAFDPKPTRASTKTSASHTGRQVPGMDGDGGERLPAGVGRQHQEADEDRRPRRPG